MVSVVNPDVVTRARRSLDFVILGTARSGTTALGTAVNLDPACFCGIEYFRGDCKMDYRTLSLPEDFLNDKHGSSHPKNAEETQRILRDKLAAGPVSCFGNKQPRYYFLIGKLHRELPDLRSVTLYRNPGELASSWDRRAANPKDRWHSGRSGVMALMNWAVEMSRFGDSIHNLSIADYGATFFKSPDTFAAIMQHITGRAAGQHLLRAFTKEVFRANGDKRPVGTMAGPHADFLTRIGVPELDHAMRASAFVPNAQVAPMLRDFSDRAFVATFAYAVDSIVKNDNADEMNYLANWARTMITLYDDPTSRTYLAMKTEFSTAAERLRALGSEAGKLYSRKLTNLLRLENQQT